MFDNVHIFFLSKIVLIFSFSSYIDTINENNAKQ